MRKKIRCSNCGTVIKDEDKSCSVCHRIIESKIKEEKKEEYELKATFPYGKVVMGIFILIGIILTIKGVVEYQNIEYCTAEDCGFKSLFIAGIGIILIISASIALARDKKRYK